ncbi:hypothetical protein Bhyg_01308, partial [Pseudolycoriella hygida]
DGEQSSSETPIDDVPTLPEVTQTETQPELQPPNRRVITYDQRQEGKYNIRADLENFVIMVIPSSPSSAVSLLDLLTRSKTKKHHGKSNLKRKYHPKSDGDVKQGVKNLDYLPMRTADHSERSNTRIIEHFIEGRTPYKVDISRAGEYLHPNVPVVQPNLRSARSIIVSLNVGNRDQFAVTAENVESKSDDGLSSSNDDKGWELTLLGSQEQCGPDRKRDSYGVCQFVPQDF